MVFSPILNNNYYQEEAIDNRGQGKSSTVKPQEGSQK